MSYRATPCSICGELESASVCPRCQRPLCEPCHDRRGDKAWQAYEVAVAEHEQQLRASRRRSVWAFILYQALAFFGVGWLYIGEVSRPSWWDPFLWIALAMAFLVGCLVWGAKNMLQPRPPDPEIFNLTPCSDSCEPAGPLKLRRPVDQVLKP